MSKLQRVLSAAAVLLLAGGISVGIALRDAGIAEDMTCKQWCASTEKHADPTTHETFFIAISDGTPIPKAWPEGDDGRVLGDCSGGTCDLTPTGCAKCPVVYTYHASSLVAGYRLYEVRAPIYIAGGWRLWANDTPGVHWWQSFGQVIDACTANLTGSQCLNILESDERCWMLSTVDDCPTGVGAETRPVTRFCRYGRVFGCGMGGTLACPYGQAVAVMPCGVDRGAGSETIDTERVFEPAEFDEL